MLLKPSFLSSLESMQQAYFPVAPTVKFYNFKISTHFSVSEKSICLLQFDSSKNCKRCLKRGDKEDQLLGDTAANDSITMADISILAQHRSVLVADLKSSFRTLDTKLEKIQATVFRQEQQITPLETHMEDANQCLAHLNSTCSILAQDNKRL